MINKNENKQPKKNKNNKLMNQNIEYFSSSTYDLNCFDLNTTAQ